MRIFVDITEPGALFHHLARRGEDAGIRVERSILHKRVGLGERGAEKHPFYGLGADYVICDNELVAAAAIERKNLDDLAKRISLADPKGQPRIFRQLRELTAHPLPILLLKGPASALYQRIEPLSAGLQFWAVRQGISIVYTSSPIASANAILGMAKKLGKELELYAPPARLDDPDETPLHTPRSG